MAQSLAREVNEKGIHVVHVVLDGLIDCQWTREMFHVNAENAMNPKDLAGVYFNLIQQPKSVWTHELDLRPQTELF